MLLFIYRFIFMFAIIGSICFYTSLMVADCFEHMSAVIIFASGATAMVITGVILLAISLKGENVQAG